MEEASADAELRAYERTGRSLLRSSSLLCLLVSCYASWVVGAGVIWRVSHTRRPRNGLQRRSISCLERRVAAQRQTGARCPTPRAQPRCNSLKQRRPDGPTQPRDPTKRRARPQQLDSKAAPKPCPVGSTTSGGATSATPARTPCERRNVPFVARRRLELASARFRTGGTCSSI